MYTLTTCKLALEDMLVKRVDDLRKTKAGSYYEPMLKEQLADIQSLPPELTGGTPLADELDALDDEHDRYGEMIHGATEVTLCDPEAGADLKASARRIQGAFIPNLKELSAKYAVEAKRAKEREPLLATLEADLQQFPIAGAAGRTLLDVAKAFIGKGKEIDSTLSDRADIIQKSRAKATSLRSSTIGMLNRFRADMARELTKDVTLPQDLDARVFGYLDTLQSMQRVAAVKPVPAPPTDSTVTEKKPEE